MFDRQSVERAGLEEILRQMPAGAIAIEAGSEEIILANQQARRLVEQNLGESMPSDLSGLSGFRMFHPDGRPCGLEELPLTRSIRSGEEVREEEYFYTLAGASTLWLRLESSPIYDDAGRLIAAILIAYDVTERKRHEISQQRLAAAVERSPDFIGLADLQWRATYVNEAGQRLVGHSGTDEVRRMHVLDYMMPEDRPFVRDEVMPAVMERGYWTGEFRLRHLRTGAPIPVHWDLIRIDDPRTGEPINLATVTRDITESLRYQEEIRTRARQQAAVAQLGQQALQSPCPNRLIDAAASLVASNLEVAYSMIAEPLGNGEELLLRSGVGWREGLVGSAGQASLAPLAAQTLRFREPVIVEDLDTDTRFGPSEALREHGVVSAVTVVIPGSEAPLGILGAYATSHRHFSEDDLSFLQAVANVLATAIERQRSEERLAEVREAERNRIARDLHDEALRELTQALAEAQYLGHVLDDAEELSQRQGRLVTALGRAGQQLRGAIYDLRLESQQGRLLTELLQSLVEQHRAMNPECDIHLDIKEDAALRDFFGDKGREILRILAEALTNARLHSGAYNVTVAAEAAQDTLRAEVRDDGRGFEPAQQTPGEASAAYGTGIQGMRERANAIGAGLEIESQRGQGTTVRLEFVLEREPQAAYEQQDEQSVRILLVEDHTSVREAIAACFEREAGFEIAGQVASMDEARRILTTQPVDVALVDLGLPDGYGGDLIRELRETNPECQALVLSANLGREEMARAVEAGASGILHKTAHLHEVTDSIRRLRAGETLMDLEEVVELLRFASTEREQEREARQSIERLTPRELEVLQALADGLDSEGIAGKLHISLRTQRNHMANIFSKLGVHTQLQALVFALRHGLVELP